MQQHGVSAPDQPLIAPLRVAVQPLTQLLWGLVMVPLVLCWPRSLPASAAPAPPAGEAEMTLYSGIAAVNVCIARGAGVDFEQAVVIAGETIAQLIQSQHGGVISLVGSESLSLDDLRKGSINSAVLGAVEVCPDQVPEAVRQSVQASLRLAEREAASQAPAATPRRRGR
jgi:hypothetical protein